MRIGILGAGCIGLYLGGRILRDKRAEVVFIGRPRFADIIKRHGLHISSFDDKVTANFEFKDLTWSSDPRALAEHKVDVVLVTVKCDATSSIAQELGPLPTSVPIISLQNGIHNADVLQQLLPAHTVLPAMVGWNVAELGDGQIVKLTPGKLVVDQRCGAELGAILATAIPVTMLPAVEVRKVQYGKLLVNLINAVSALSGRPNVELLLDRGYRTVFAALQEEGLRVYRAAGIQIRSGLPIPIPMPVVPHILRFPTPLYARVAATSLKIDPRSRSSMLQDLDAKRPKTEIDELNGEIVALGAKHKVPTPLNSKICELVHDAEKAGSGSPCLSSAHLLEQLRAVDPNVDRNFNLQFLLCLLLIVAFIVFLIRR